LEFFWYCFWSLLILVGFLLTSFWTRLKDFVNIFLPFPKRLSTKPETFAFGFRRIILKSFQICFGARLAPTPFSPALFRPGALRPGQRPCARMERTELVTAELHFVRACYPMGPESQHASLWGPRPLCADRKHASRISRKHASLWGPNPNMLPYGARGPCASIESTRAVFRASMLPYGARIPTCFPTGPET